MIDKLVQDDAPTWAANAEGMKKAASQKYREYIRETLAEY